jgi:hypothetical protein
MTKRTILLLGLILTIATCTDDKLSVFPESIIFHDNRVTHTHLTNGKIIEINPITSIYRFEIIDSLLVCSGTSVDNSCRMHIYNLNTNKRIASFADEGRGPGEFIRVDAFNLNRIKREVHITDNNQQLLIRYSIDSLIKDTQSPPLQKVSFRDSFYTPEFLIDENSYLCDMAMPLRSTNVLTKVDYPSFETIKVAKYPILKDFDTVKLARYYQNVFGRNISYSSEARKIIVSYVTTDLIEIYDEDIERIARIHGPDHFFPEYEVTGTPTTYSQMVYKNRTIKGNVIMGLTVSQKKGLARWGYVYVTTSPKGVYAVYSGDFVAENNTTPPSMKTIYFFDYKGKATRKITVESGDVYVIKVDQLDEKLYTLYDGNLMVYNLNQ